MQYRRQYMALVQPFWLHIRKAGLSTEVPRVADACISMWLKYNSYMAALADMLAFAAKYSEALL
jgi:hypothetical protein